MVYNIVPARIYLLKVNNRNIRTRLWNIFKVNNKDTRKMPSAWIEQWQLNKQAVSVKETMEAWPDTFFEVWLLCSKNAGFTCFNESPLKMIKNGKILMKIFVLKLLDMKENSKTRKRRLISKFMMSSTGKQIKYKTHIAQYLKR